ncbi:MAG TPA: nicotinate (nicotinamide) nucleotide adenylyltransferase [Candidatus Krumholzibacteria bacterium]|nr:nicotinate (nicotinamide) nucleotide adenylyltransferase [Candidatus Krumholzibacteria bacterium]
MTPDPSEDWKGNRIGILGGTFDPPHVGHTRMAAAARDALGLDRVFCSPAPHPPHKSDAETTSYRHRRAMLEFAIAGEDRVAVTGIEESHATSYTVDLLRACRERTSADLYFIMGADSLAGLPTWRDPADVMRLATLVVFPRGREIVRAPDAREVSLVVFESPVIDVSSTEIRERLARGETSVGGLAPAVARYVAHHRLYARG